MSRNEKRADAVVPREKIKSAFETLQKFERATDVASDTYHVYSVEADIRKFANELGEGRRGKKDAKFLLELCDRLNRTIQQGHVVEHPACTPFSDPTGELGENGVEKHFIECLDQRFRSLMRNIGREAFKTLECEGCIGNCKVQCVPIGTRGMTVPCICETTKNVTPWKYRRISYVSTSHLK